MRCTSLAIAGCAIETCPDRVAAATTVTLPQAGHGFGGDPPGLEDPAVTAGASVRATSRCRSFGPEPLAPSWDFVAASLHRALDHGRRQLASS
jgi:hypothetical protein